MPSSLAEESVAAYGKRGIAYVDRKSVTLVGKENHFLKKDGGSFEAQALWRELSDLRQL